MAIASNSGGSAAITSASTTFTVDITAAAVGADCFCWNMVDVTSATMSLTGWTTIATKTTASTLTVGLFYRRKVSGDTTFAGTQTSGRGAHAWVSYTGLDATTPYEAASATNIAAKSSVATTVATPSITEAGGDSLALGFFASRTSTSSNKAITFTPPTGWTERFDVNNSAAASSPWLGLEIADSVSAVTAGAHTYTATASFSEQYGAAALLYLNPSTVANPLIETLTDDFSTQNARWSLYNGATVSGGQLNIPIAGTNTNYAGADATLVAQRYNGIGTSAFAKITHGTLGSSQEAAFEFVADDGTSKIAIYRSGSTTDLLMRVIQGGATTQATTMTNVTDPWWKIVTTATTAQAFTSADGLTWTARSIVSPSGGLSSVFSSVRPNISAGDYLGTGVARTVTADNYNVAPAAPVAFTGTVALSGTGTQAPTGSGRTTGSLGLSGTGTLDGFVPSLAVTSPLGLSGDSALTTDGNANSGGAVGTILLQQDFSGVPDGQALTLANSAATGQNAFDSITVNGTVVSDSANQLHGKRTLTDQTSTTAVANNFGWNSAKMGASATRFFRFYLYVGSIPGSTITIGRWTVGGTSTLLGSTVLTNTGLLRITNSAGTTIGTMSTAVPTGQWIRVEGSFVSATSTTGSASLSYYTSPESTTPTQTVSGSATNFGTGNIDTVRFGHTQSVASVDLHFADIAVANDAAIGPVSAAAPPTNLSDSIALSGTGTPGLAGAPAIPGPVSLSGAGSQQLAGSPGTTASEALSGSGSFGASGRPSVPGTVSTSGSGALSPSGTPSLAGPVALSGAGTFAGTGTAVQQTVVTGSVTLNGTGTEAGTGTPKPTSSLAATGAGTFAGSGTSSQQTVVTGTVALAGTGTPAFTGTPSTTASFGATGTGSQSTPGTPKITSAAALLSTGTLAPAGSPRWTAALAASGTGTLLLVGTPNWTGTLARSGAGSLLLAGTPRPTGSLSSLGFGFLTEQGVFNREPRDITITVGPPVLDWDSATSSFDWAAPVLVLTWDSSTNSFEWVADLSSFVWDASADPFAWAGLTPDFPWSAGPPDFD